jgi:hypothetical protein
MAPPPTPQIAPLINLSTADPIAELTAMVTVLRDAVHTLSVQMADHTYGMSQMHTESSDTTHRIWRMERIMLVMCEHGNIDLSNTDLGNITNPSTSAGQCSPVLNFHGLSISRGGGGGRGSVTLSTHSGAHSRELHKSFPTYSIFKRFVARAQSLSKPESRHLSRGRGV